MPPAEPTIFGEPAQAGTAAPSASRGWGGSPFGRGKVLGPHASTGGVGVPASVRGVRVAACPDVAGVPTEPLVQVAASSDKAAMLSSTRRRM